MKKCPICDMRMRVSTRISQSQGKRRIIFYCANCHMWYYPEFLKKKKQQQ